MIKIDVIQTYYIMKIVIQMYYIVKVNVLHFDVKMGLWIKKVRCFRRSE